MVFSNKSQHKKVNPDQRKIQNEILELNRVKERLIKDVEDKQKMAETNEVLGVSLQNTEEILKQKQRELAGVEKEIKNLSDTRIKTVSILASLENKLLGLKAEIEGVNKDLSEIHEEYQAIRKMKKSEEAKRLDLLTELAVVNKEVLDSKEKRDLADKQLIEVKKALKEKKVEIDELNDEIVRLNSNFEALSVKGAKTANLIAELEKQRGERELGLRNLEEKVFVYEKNLEVVKTAKAIELEKSLASKIKEYEEKEGELSIRESWMKDKELELKDRIREAEKYFNRPFKITV